MANHSSAKKRIRRNQKRFHINHSRLNRIKTIVKKVDAAIDSKDVDAANKAFKEAMPEIMKGKTRGIFHPNTASRKISRLNARIKSISV